MEPEEVGLPVLGKVMVKLTDGRWGELTYGPLRGARVIMDNGDTAPFDVQRIEAFKFPDSGDMEFVKK
jgi:hypothetical protein